MKKQLEDLLSFTSDFLFASKSIGELKYYSRKIDEYLNLPENQTTRKLVQHEIDGYRLKMSLGPLSTALYALPLGLVCKYGSDAPECSVAVIAAVAVALSKKWIYEWQRTCVDTVSRASQHIINQRLKTIDTSGWRGSEVEGYFDSKQEPNQKEVYRETQGDEWKQGSEYERTEDDEGEDWKRRY